MSNIRRRAIININFFKTFRHFCCKSDGRFTKIICSSTDVFRNCFILQRAVVGFFLQQTVCGDFFILWQTFVWENCDAWNLIFLRLSIVFIHEFCDKMSNRNIPNPNKKNWQFLARLWDAAKRRGDGKFYCPCS